MMRKMAIGLAVATIVMGGTTLGASTLHGDSGISKSSVSRSISSNRFGPRTIAYEEERGRGYERGERYIRVAEYTPDRWDAITRHRGERYSRYDRSDRFAERGRYGEREYSLGRYERAPRYGERYRRYGERYGNYRPYRYQHYRRGGASYGRGD
jgi:hypothetical protein